MRQYGPGGSLRIAGAAGMVAIDDVYLEVAFRS